jgi:quercetin dioxygenase-like cupin family protein
LKFRGELTDAATEKLAAEEQQIAEELKKQLRQQESWLRGTGRSSKTLVKYPDLRVVLISMKANTVMKEHKTEARITILTVAGHIRLHLADATIELPVGNLLALDGAVAHDVEALKQSVFLLTISWPKNKHGR